MLDNVPVATPTFLAGLVVIVVAYILNDLGLSEALKDVGYVGVGSGFIGHARNGAGKGIRTH
jgi:hypothetical protein